MDSWRKFSVHMVFFSWPVVFLVVFLLQYLAAIQGTFA